MEVGAVKQAFNNEVILLKKNLNQAKIQIIHKLTRKAKTFAEKKCPEPLKEKLKRKAESAVKEVLLIKKIKPKDIARFIVTHKGKLNEYLNKPNVDNDKACARLLLHKALANKYQLIKDRFGNVAIHDLLMSRQERRQLKKDAKEKQKDKRKKRANSETDNVGGVWDVEVNKPELNNGDHNSDQDGDSSDESGAEAENGIESEEDSISKEELDEESDNDGAIQSKVKIPNNKLKSNSKSMPSKQKNIAVTDADSEDIETSDNDSVIQSKVKITNNKLKSNSKSILIKQENITVTDLDSEEDIETSDNDSVIQSKVKISNEKFKTNSKSVPTKQENITFNDAESEEDNQTSDEEEERKSIEVNIKSKPHINDTITLNKLDKTANRNAEKRLKDNNKNKNLNEKLKKRKFNKDSNDLEEQKTHIVDSFFITSSGENYMSLVEPRPPDEVKAVHKEGNRKYRRAVMFGHNIPKPRRNDFRQNNSKSNEQRENKNRNNDFKSNSMNRRNNFTSREQDGKNVEDAIPEKLHPSWEAKKRQSTAVAFKGKKIMFDDS